MISREDYVARMRAQIAGLSKSLYERDQEIARLSALVKELRSERDTARKQSIKWLCWYNRFLGTLEGMRTAPRYISQRNGAGEG